MSIASCTKDIPPPVWRLSALAIGLGWVACATAPAPQTAPPPAAVQVAAETSVRPDANREYLKADLDVKGWTERFERAGRDIFDKRDAIVAAAGIKPGVTIGDVGAGTGLFSVLFAQAVGPQGRVYAIDIAPSFIQHLDAKLQSRGIDNVTTILSTDRSISLPQSTIDVAFVCDVYHHFEYPKSMLASIHKALRPGGALVVIDFRRVKGKSADWIFEHVRAGQEVFTAEIVAAGFDLIAETALLDENYFLRFRRR